MTLPAPVFRPGPLALLGHPVGHSLSPLIHNTALRAVGREPCYVACDVMPDDLPAATHGLRSLGFAGANVTIPHKQAIVPLLDGLTGRARVLGAVNTVVVSRVGDRIQLVGHNTDVHGFLAPLTPLSGRRRGHPALIWGAGGAARAVVSGLSVAFSPAFITVVARQREQFQMLAQNFEGAEGIAPLRFAEWPLAPEALRAHDVLVNSTPLGMHPHVEVTPCQDTRGLRPGQLVYDLVYRPERTRLLADAEAAGARPLGGLSMLIGQAAEAFRLWTGLVFAEDDVRREVRQFFDEENEP